MSTSYDSKSHVRSVNKEEWRDIIGFVGYYQISSYCRVRSVNRIYKGRNLAGKMMVRRKGRPMKVKLEKSGYLRIGLRREGTLKMLLVHRLLWIAFVGEIPAKMQR